MWMVELLGQKMGKIIKCTRPPRIFWSFQPKKYWWNSHWQCICAPTHVCYIYCICFHPCGFKMLCHFCLLRQTMLLRRAFCTCLLVANQNCKTDNKWLKTMHQFERKKKEHNMNAKRCKQVVPFCPISLIPFGFLIFRIFLEARFCLQIPAWCWVWSCVDRCG